MTEYVKMGNKVIETKETDRLFKYLWENCPDDIEKLGADTDDENNFGEVTHLFTCGELHKL